LAEPRRQHPAVHTREHYGWWLKPR
jgi:hypothetical protein